ncbi:hypothetical protein H6F32_13670 [Anabaena sp. FACHB-1237]|uniref:hypothetical protein n=1 Tax=Anabaena sp. FACHB-1237 TaxID=2692769 RepID=UPI0016819B1E|nr:hypothetical protein [Anabaena sp. FACHB-1237]MBD2138612.1 hypothetical protein [Anabaena sp. FACHB-1237]
MTSYKDEIQQLIEEIDQVLTHNHNGLSKLIFNQSQQERELFKRVRNLLVNLEEQYENRQIDTLESSIETFTEQPATESSTPPSTVTPFSSLLTQFSEKTQQNNTQNQSSQTITQSVESEVNFTEIKQGITVVIQSLQSELYQMLQERTNLMHEIRQLEQKRLQNYSLSRQLANQEQIISEFLEALMSRLAPHLISNLNANNIVGNAGVKVAQESNQKSNLDQEYPEDKEDNLEALNSAIKPILDSAEKIEQLAHLVKNLDQRLLSLDGTVNTIFEALERNINTYYQSLSQGLSKMHSQGMQGEQLMASFLDNLTRYLQQYSLNIEPIIQASGIQDNQELTPVSNLLVPSENEETSASSDVNDDNRNNEYESSSRLLESRMDILNEPLFTVGENIHLTNLISGNVVQEVSEDDADAVDELYATFLNWDHPPEISVSIPEREDENFSIGLPATTDQPIVDTIKDLSNSDDVNDVISREQEDNLQDNILVVPNVWHETIEDDQNNPDVLVGDSFNDEAIPQLNVELNLEEILSDNSVDNNLPDNVDIITVLTDLVVDTLPDNKYYPDDQESETAENLSQNILVDTIPQDGTKLENNIDYGYDHPYNYVMASPQDDLLSLLDNDLPNVPEIVLDEQQLQSLDQDLANFDLDQSLNKSANEVNSGIGVDIQQFTDVPKSVPQEQIQVEITDHLVRLLEEEKQDSLPQTTSQTITQEILQDALKTPENVDHNVDDDVVNNTWYLGLDLGTTGISAALFNYDGLVVYPIYWSAAVQTIGTIFQQSFRLPAEVYLPSNVIPISEIVGNNQQLFSAQLKPYLHIGVAYQQERQKWEPVLQLNEFSAGPLIWVVRSLSKLLLTLKSSQTSTTPALIANAVGIDHPTFSRIINNITGVICNCPSAANEQYRFNVREAILTSKLVEHGQQVLFVEEAIASLLPELDNTKIQPVQLSETQGFRDIKNNDHPILGNTLSINIGAISTEMTLIDIPTNLEGIRYKDFMLHSFSYAGKAIEQDIICQLLLPPKSRQPRLSTDRSHNSTENPWHWQPSIPGLDGIQFSNLKLENLELPRVAEPDTLLRIRLQQKLESSILGQALLDAALALKLILQHQETFTLEFADQHWSLSRRDLESQIFVPFVRRLNRELNKLLVTRGIPTEAINQAVINGGVASIGTINRWLKQKLPNAQIIHNSYSTENGSPNCSRVALGLSMLPLYPQILNVPQQQYSDYFLFSELLKILPDRTLSFPEVLQLFENRGINTRICQQRLLAFLEGELPPGLIPAYTDNVWLTQQSQHNADYQAIASTALFTKQGNLSYRPNSQQVMLLVRYLEKIKSSTLQSLDEPCSINLQPSPLKLADR